MSAGKPLRALIVEDSESDAELLAFELRHGGYEVTTARVETAAEMGAALEREPWDLVIADCSLPHFSGLAALRLLQEREIDLPFILVSGTVGEECAVDAMKAGADDFILKGRMARLVPAIERALREAGGRAARRQAELALQESERRFRSLIEHMSGIIAVLAADGTILYTSPSVEPTLGFTAEELNHENLAAYVHAEDLTTLAAFLEDARRQPGILLPVEFRIRHRDGTWRTLASTGRSLLDDPALRGIILNARDVTDRKELEERLRQSEKMEAIGRLAGGVAHDFNNMLGAITGYSDLLMQRAGSDETIRECLEEIVKAAERATSLTQQLLFFSRKRVLAPRVLDLGEVVAGMHRMLERLIGEDIELVTACDPQLSRVKADRGQIEQVVLNLAVNARDAMPQGGQLTIETRNIHLEGTEIGSHVGVPPGSYVLLSVTDTGRGIDAESRSRLFEPFFTTKGPGQGTGLGLATVYGIVQQVEGQITVESQPGHGSTFRIYLPCTGDAAWHEEPSAPSTRPPHGSETILLVEDEEIIRRLFSQVLGIHGYRVLEAAQGEEALQHCNQFQQPIDLLLTDVVMPGMSGRELAERAARVRPEIKVLFMSGYTDDAVVRNGVLDAGMAFLQKPFTPAVLAQKVREVLAGS